MKTFTTLAGYFEGLQGKELRDKVCTVIEGLEKVYLNNDMEQETYDQIAEGIRRVREGRIHIEPGYDGQYGVVKVFTPEEQIKKSKKNDKQESLF